MLMALWCKERAALIYRAHKKTVLISFGIKPVRHLEDSKDRRREPTAAFWAFLRVNNLPQLFVN